MVLIEIDGELLLGRVLPLLRPAITAAGNGPIRLQLDSPGGNALEAQMARAALAAHAGGVDVEVLRAESAAAMLSTVGRTVTIAPAGWMTIHNPVCPITLNNSAADLRATANHLDALTREIARLHAKRSRLPVARVRELMDAACRHDAKRAVRLGLADRIDKSLPAPTATESAVRVAWLKD